MSLGQRGTKCANGRDVSAWARAERLLATGYWSIRTDNDDAHKEVLRAMVARVD